MRFTVRCLGWHTYQVIDLERVTSAGTHPVLSTWRTYAGALAVAQFHNERGA